MKIENKLLRLSPNYYAFISGVVVSIATELFLGIFSGGEIASQWPIQMIGSICALISSLFWSVIAWNIGAIQNAILESAPPSATMTAIEEVWQTKLTPRLPRLRIYFIVAFITLVMGLASLPTSALISTHKINETAPVDSTSLTRWLNS